MKEKIENFEDLINCIEFSVNRGHKISIIENDDYTCNDYKLGFLDGTVLIVTPYYFDMDRLMNDLSQDYDNVEMSLVDEMKVINMSVK